MLSSHQLLEEPFRRGNVASGAEQELNRITCRIYRSVQILPLGSYLHIGLVEALGGAAHLRMRANPLVDFRGEALYPSPHGCVLYGQTTLTHHLFQVAVGELVFAMPTDAQKDERRLEVAPLERGLRMLQEEDSRRMM
jgi:hypothetical protein